MGCGICEYGKGKRIYLDGHTSALLDQDTLTKEWYLVLASDDECYGDGFASATVQYCPWCGRKLE